MSAPELPPSGTVLLAMRCFSRMADLCGAADELAFSADRFVPAAPEGDAAWTRAVAAAAFECELPAALRGAAVPCARCGAVAAILALDVRGAGEGAPHVVLALAAPDCQREDCERAIGDAFAAKAEAFFDVQKSDYGTPLDTSSLDHANRAAICNDDVLTINDEDASLGFFAAEVTARGPGPIALCFVRFLDLGPSADAAPATLSDYVLVHAVPDEIAAQAGSGTLAVESFALEASSEQVDIWGVDELLRRRDLRCYHCGGECWHFLAREAAYPSTELNPGGAFPVVAAVGVFAVPACTSPGLQPGLPGLPMSKEAALQRALSDGQRALGRLAGCMPSIERRYLRAARLCSFCLAGPPPGALPWLGCTACRSARYCCREHQERDWDRHRPACGSEAIDAPRDRQGFGQWMMGECWSLSNVFTGMTELTEYESLEFLTAWDQSVRDVN